jgi:hypothetical protein
MAGKSGGKNVAGKSGGKKWRERTVLSSVGAKVNK